MCCRSRPQYRSDLGWILGVAFLGTLTRSARPAQGFTLVRCCSLPSGFFPTRPHGARARASHDGDPCMQLPSARGCYQLAPQRTLTSNPVPMPGTPMAFGRRRRRAKSAPLTASKLRKFEASMRSTARCVAERGGAAPVEKIWGLPPYRDIVQFVSCRRNSAVAVTSVTSNSEVGLRQQSQAFFRNAGAAVARTSTKIAAATPQ